MAETSVKRFLPVLTGAALAVSLALALLTGLLYVAGTNADWMHAMLTHHAPSDMTGLPESEYRPMAEMITSYLAGKHDTFQHTFIRESDGVTLVCFDGHEQQHMADCYLLFRMCRTAMLASCAAAVALASSAHKRKRNLRQTCIGALIGFCAVLAAAAVLIVWGMTDFDGLFILFHQLSFANDLWMLNPATDLLIRLMPTSFFVSYAAMIGFGWAALCAAGASYAAVLLRRMK